MKDQFFMGVALAAAVRAYQLGEVPIGAVVVRDNRILAVAGNAREQLKDPTAHAEIIALQQAARCWGDWRLCDSKIYVTLEPCPMCAGAMLQARVKTVIFGARDPKGGALGSVVNLAEIPGFNHRLEVRGGLSADKSSALLKKFFRTLR